MSINAHNSSTKQRQNLKIGMSHKKYLIMAAVGRSGTTALRKGLGEHREIYYNGRENNQVQDILACAYRNRTQPSRVNNLAVDLATYDQCFADLITKLMWPNQFKRLTRKALMIAINPQPEYVDFIFELFPGAKMLYLVRNGIDVVCSRQKFKAFSQDDFKTHCQVWLRSFEMFKWVQERPDTSFLFRYENLLDANALKAELGNFFEFFGIRNDPKVAEHILSHQYHPTSGGVKRDAAKSLSDEESQATNNRESPKWSVWSDEQRKLFKDLCGKAMKEMGYDIPW